MRTVALVTLVLAACGQGPYYGSGSTAPVMTGPQTGDPQQTAADNSQPEAAADTRSAGQVIADILTQQGYTCTARDADWECNGPNNKWQFYVSYVPSQDGSTTAIWFDTYLERAFGKPCTNFTDAQNDLDDANANFQASCDDTSKKWRFNTAVTYGSDMDVMGWVHDHESRRAKAAVNLRDIHAISKDSARLLDGR